MADLNRYLRRFWRLVSPPGRAGPVAVPVDRVSTVSEELAHVFELIDAVQAEADRIREDGERAARNRRDEAELQANGVLADARAGVDQARAEAQAHHRRDIEHDTEATLRAARREADAVKAQADDGIDALAQRIADELLAFDARAED